ncbi:MAG: glycosyltransferase family 4 protein [Ignavibacteriae bacterium]|nr:glycosyltransferase family 4 protein [Ignavibacteriota bacterium]
MAAEVRPIRLVFDAHAITTARSGIGAYSVELCAALAEHHTADVELHVYARGRITRARTRAELLDVTAGIEAGALYRPGHQREIPRLVQKGQHDLFHAPDFLAPYFLRAVPVVTTVHDIVPLALPGMLARSKKTRLLPLYRLAVMQAFRRSARIITVSAFSRSEFARILGIDTSRVDVIHVAPEIAMSGSPFPARLRTAAAPGSYFLYIGRRDPYKGLALMLRAYARALREGPLPPLLVAGPEDPRYPLMELARQCGVEDRVHATGYLEESELSSLLAHATALVFPSLYEGFGVPPLDAMAHGVPVLSSGRASLPEVTGDAALEADPENEEQFSAAMRRIASDDTLRVTLAARGRTRAAAFTWQAAAARTVDVYRRALGGGA